jgi:hypothetical protein
MGAHPVYGRSGKSFRWQASLGNRRQIGKKTRGTIWTRTKIPEYSAEGLFREFNPLFPIISVSQQISKEPLWTG